MSCPHCNAPFPEGAKICRSCGRIVGGGGSGGGASSASAGPAPHAEKSSRPAVSVSGPAPKCEVCDKSPTMIAQAERNSPIAPAAMGFVAFLLLVMALAWHSWLMRFVLVAAASGLMFVAYRYFTAERRYWLCPRCGDTLDIA